MTVPFSPVLSLGRPKEPIWLFLRTFLGLAYLFGIKPKVSAREPHGRFFDLLTSSVKTIMEPLQADAVRVGSAAMNERLVSEMTKLFNANAVKTAINRLHDQTPRP